MPPSRLTSSPSWSKSSCLARDESFTGDSARCSSIQAPRALPLGMPASCTWPPAAVTASVSRLATGYDLAFGETGLSQTSTRVAVSDGSAR